MGKFIFYNLRYSLKDLLLKKKLMMISLKTLVINYFQDKLIQTYILELENLIMLVNKTFKISIKEKALKHSISKDIQ